MLYIVVTKAVIVVVSLKIHVFHLVIKKIPENRFVLETLLRIDKINK